MNTLKILLVSFGFYPSTLIGPQAEKGSFLSKLQIWFSATLTLLSGLFLVITGTNFFTADTSLPGGPIITYSLILTVFMLRLLIFVLRFRLTAIFRTSLNNKFVEVYRRHLKLLQVLRLPHKNRYLRKSMVCFVLTSVAELVFQLFSTLAITTPFGLLEKNYYSILPRKLALGFAMFEDLFDILFLYPHIIDIIVYVVMCYMQMIARVLEQVDCQLKMNLQAIKKLEIERRNAWESEEILGQANFMLEESSFRTFSGENKVPATDLELLEPETLFQVCEELVDLWDETKDMTGLILLLVFSMWTIVLGINTFHVISSTSDTGTILNPLVYGFYVYGGFLAAKLITSANTAQAVQDEVAKLRNTLSRVSFDENVDGLMNSETFRLTKSHLRPRELAVKKICKKLDELFRGNKLRVDASGFFRVERRTLTAIAGVISTYTVVLLQFWMNYSLSSANRAKPHAGGSIKEPFHT